MIRRTIPATLLITIFFVVLLSLAYAPTVHSAGGNVLAFRLTGTISNAQADAFSDALNTASSEGDSAVILVLSTPGGSLDAMLRIITAIENSPIPVIAYVYPAGTTAWSAGTYLLMASHLAAMAPNTIIGSCQPVEYSPLGSVPVNDTKIINAVVSVMVTQAKAHNRNETLAVQFITENTNVNDEEAYRYKVIEFRANDLESLLQQVDGRAVNTTSGTVVLNTQGATVIEYSFRLRDSIINVISDPLISDILFIVGIFSLIFGFHTPGHGGEILGGVALLLAFVGMGFDINIISIVMIAFGAILLIYELATPGFGVFGFSGLIILTIGSLFLIPFSPEKWLVSTDWYATFTYSVLAASICIAAIFLFMIIKILQIRRKRPTVGVLIGDEVVASEDMPPGTIGFILYKGEYWKAKCEKGIIKDKRYKIINKDGPTLILEEMP
jgi:membrane-bound serine protease (ClpP class)